MPKKRKSKTRRHNPRNMTIWEKMYSKNYTATGRKKKRKY